MNLLNTKDLVRVLNLPPKAIDRIVKLPSFPPPAIYASQKSRVWRLESVEKWVVEQEKRNG